MNLTDNEIIKALECCVRSTSGNDCEKLHCPACKDFGCHYMDSSDRDDSYEALVEGLGKDALDLISRQKATIKEFDEKIVMQMGLIEYQKAEIERLQKAGKESVDCFTRMETLYKIKCKELEVAKSSAIKEFAEKLKEKQRRMIDYDEAGWGSQIFIVEVDAIDNLVKEITRSKRPNI